MPQSNSTTFFFHKSIFVYVSSSCVWAPLCSRFLNVVRRAKAARGRAHLALELELHARAAHLLPAPDGHQLHDVRIHAPARTAPRFCGQRPLAAGAGA